jgi:hypothetical protein
VKFINLYDGKRIKVETPDEHPRGRSVKFPAPTRSRLGEGQLLFHVVRRGVESRPDLRAYMDSLEDGAEGVEMAFNATSSDIYADTLRVTSP